MLLTPHILTGVAIITLVQNPILGLIFVLSSHYFLDSLPQTQYSIKNIISRQWEKTLPDFTKTFLDILFGFIIVFLTAGFTPLIWLAVFAAILPDGLTLLYCIFPTNWLLRKHRKMHMAINAICENKKLPAIWGIVSQIIVVAVAIYLLR